MDELKALIGQIKGLITGVFSLVGDLIGAAVAFVGGALKLMHGLVSDGLAAIKKLFE